MEGALVVHCFGLLSWAGLFGCDTVADTLPVEREPGRPVVGGSGALQEIRVPPGRVLKRVLGAAVFRARGIPKVSCPRQYASPGADTTASRAAGAQGRSH